MASRLYKGAKQPFIIPSSAGSAIHVYALIYRLLHATAKHLLLTTFFDVAQIINLIFIPLNV